VPPADLPVPILHPLHRGPAPGAAQHVRLEPGAVPRRQSPPPCRRPGGGGLRRGGPGGGRRHAPIGGAGGGRGAPALAGESVGPAGREQRHRHAVRPQGLHAAGSSKCREICIRKPSVKVHVSIYIWKSKKLALCVVAALLRRITSKPEWYLVSRCFICLYVYAGFTLVVKSLYNSEK